MRDRLIELIDYGSNDYASYSCEMAQAGNYGMESMGEFIADKILADGWFRPPCKVGDMLFALWSVPTEAKYVIYAAEVVEIRIAGRNCRQTTTFLLEPLAYRGRRKEYRIDDFGKLVFTNKEEAEQALRKDEGK